MLRMTRMADFISATVRLTIVDHNLTLSPNWLTTTLAGFAQVLLMFHAGIGGLWNLGVQSLDECARDRELLNVLCSFALRLALRAETARVLIDELDLVVRGLLARFRSTHRFC